MREKTNRKIVKTVALVIASVALFSAIIFSLYNFNFIEMLDFLPGIFQKDEPAKKDDSEKIKQILELLGEDPDGYQSISSDAHSLISVLSALETDDSYYHSYTVTYSYLDYSFEREMRVNVDAPRWSVQTVENGSSVSTVSFDGDKYIVRDDTADKEDTFPKSSNIRFDGHTYLAPLSEIVRLLTEYEAAQNGGTSKISDCKVELIRTQSANLVTVSFTYDSTKQHESYTVHLDYGVILGASSEIEGQIYYKVETDTFEP